MPLRSFFAFDNDNLIVTSSPSSSIVGNPVINNSDTPDGTIFQYTKGTFTEITLNDTGGGRNNFNDDREDDHVIVDGGGLVANGTEVEAESLIFVRALDANGNPTGPEITIFALSKEGVTSDVWGFGVTQPLKGGVSYIKTQGSNSGTVRYNRFASCFTRGTLIKTQQGNLPVEQIKLGQKVWTKSAGFLPVRWVGNALISGEGAMAPVVFEAGVLGNNRDLVVSQQHRVWIKSAAAELYFGQSEVLVAAKHLCGLPGVSLRPQQQVHYVHFMFDSHQIVRSNGALTESFFLAEQSLSTLEDGPRAELCALFPDLQNGFLAFGETAAPTLTAKEAATLVPYLAA